MILHQFLVNFYYILAYRRTVKKTFGYLTFFEYSVEVDSLSQIQSHSHMLIISLKRKRVLLK